MTTPTAVSAVDLWRRWEKARAAARRHASGERAFFANSLALGDSFRRYYGCELTLEQLVTLLASSAPRDLRECVLDGDGARVALTSCRDSDGDDESTCEQRREALDGLALGLTGGRVHFAQHRCVRAGDAACTGALYTDPESPSRYGLIPSDVRPQLAAAEARVNRLASPVRVRFVGLSLGTALFVCETFGCGKADLAIDAMVQAAVTPRAPGLKVANVSPRPVIDITVGDPS